MVKELIPVYCDVIPAMHHPDSGLERLEEGKIYISLKYGTAVHLCACGCLNKTVTPLKPYWKNGWVLTDNNGKITLRPSVGNFA